MPRDTVLTPQGLEDLKARIEHLRGDRRREVAERIKEAREFGDISENAEYDDAKNEQAMLEKQISDLEEKLRNARVIDEKRRRHGGREHRRDGARQGPEDRQVDEVQDRRLGRGQPGARAGSPTSRRSAASLLGHKRGDTVTVSVPRGPARKLKITKIER